MRLFPLARQMAALARRSGLRGLLALSALALTSGCGGHVDSAEWWEVIDTEGQLLVSGDADGLVGCELPSEQHDQAAFNFIVSSPTQGMVDVSVHDTQLGCTFPGRRSPAGLVQALDVACEPGEYSRFAEVGIHTRHIELFELDAPNATARFEVLTHHDAVDEAGITSSCASFKGAITQIQ